MPTPNMMQAATQIRKWWDGARQVAAWAKSHAGLVLGAMLCLVAAVWLAEHDVRIQREAELGVMRREVATEVSALRQKAEVAVEESRASERAIRDLEARRTVLEREAAALRARLNSLREEDRLGARPAITPGHNEAAGNATSRPGSARNSEIRPSTFARGPERSRTGDSGLGAGDSGLEAETGNWKLETGPSTAVSGPSSVRSEHAARAMTDSESRTPNPESLILNPARDNCREQLGLQGQLISNCEERAELNGAALEAAKHSARELGEALRAKDSMAARLEEQHRAELKVARGSRLRRFGRALQYVGAGVVIGMAVAR